MLMSLVVFAIAFALVLLFGRLAHRALHAVSLLIAGDAAPATYLYAVPLLPGVALHELSHALMALVLGVQVRSLTLTPRRKADSVTLGAVEVTRSDTLKTSLIGVAPLLSGMLVLSLIGWYVFDTRKLSEAVLTANLPAVSLQIVAALRAADAFLWFYVLFAVANTMMPSTSDTQAWPPVLLATSAVFALLAVFFGAELLRFVEPVVTRTLNWLSAVFALTAFADLAILLPLWVLVRLLERIKGKRVEFR